MAIAAFALFAWWSSRSSWGNSHRFMAVIGATLACMAAPYLTISTWPKIDVVGEIIFDAAALIGFWLLARKVFAGPEADAGLDAGDDASRDAR